MGAPSIFISHTHSDEAVANAVRDAVFALFGRDLVSVTYSTSRELGEGVRFGEDWFQWIGEQVRTATVTLVLLTPTSVQKPWVLWEAGAVYGAAVAGEGTALRRVRPVAFQIGWNDVPSPLRSSHAQIARGDQYREIKQLLDEFVSDFSTYLPGNEAIIRAAQNVAGAAEAWLTSVSDALRMSPLIPTEPVVNEWCERLDSLSDSHRYSEVQHLHEWLRVAFGQPDGAAAQPIDIRLHRRLAQLYMRSASYEAAAQEFELARRLSPRDIFVMRSLGQAYMSLRRHEEVGAVIEDIEKLDGGAFVKNAECAALKGRWYRDRGRHQDAHDVYARAFDANPDSYYLADLLAVAKLQLGDRPGAEATYRRAIEIVERNRERNIWAFATAANASIVIGNAKQAARYFASIREMEPSEADLESVDGGLMRLKSALQLGADEVAGWRALLRGTPR
ncbi:TIR domain-containing protein [Streptomyces sp. NPDC029554]|uniref:TIR domain-containing protein n=1 Tax=Streptomyces sp. NPDC029554 TaxID=3155126 RepID=UPI0033E7B105